MLSLQPLWALLSPLQRFRLCGCAQGREADVVFFTLVRTAGTINFLDERRINVAFTRAR